MSTGQKQYGLLVPKKANQGPLQPRLAIFGDNSDSDNEGGDWVRKALKKDAEKSLKKQTKLEIQRALEQDPTVYQYDEVYDKMEEKKEETKALKKDLEKKPRYIQSLLKQAERRKREQERRVEREVQKEREAEGEEFKDKEAFVTSGYRKKLEEFNKLDEEERRQDQIEALTDVSKQKDLSGFYRHMYRQAVGEEQPPGEIKIKQEKTDENETKTENSESSKDPAVEKKHRQYRKRRDSSSESEKEDKNDAKTDKNLDADSDFTGNSSSSGSDSESEQEGKKKNKSKEAEEKKEVAKTEVFTSGSEEGEIIEATEDNKQSKRKHSTEDEQKEDVKRPKKEDVETEAPKPSIWEKRTVGAEFDAALERYFARKAAKSAGRK